MSQPNSNDQLAKRHKEAYQIRKAAAKLARDRDAGVIQKNNGDEAKYSSTYAMSFTKGLIHDPTTGLVKDVSHAKQLRDAIDCGFVAGFEAIPVANFGQNERRRWEAPTAGTVFSLEGPDAQAVPFAPAPALGSPELIYEMAELYVFAALRDVRFAEFDKDGSPSDATKNAVDLLNKVFKDKPFTVQRRTGKNLGNLQIFEAFRGSSVGVDKGPYLSQFFHVGNVTLDGQMAEMGLINYGVLGIDQRVPIAKSTNFMTTKSDWLNVQNGFKPPAEKYELGSKRFIKTLRDMTTYVHYDALYEAYLNAVLTLLSVKAPFDPNFKALHSGRNVTGFALWGGPHILTLVTEVATRALKAVRFQKFNVHLRLRPEALAARLAFFDEIEARYGSSDLVSNLKEMKQVLSDVIDLLPADDKGLLPMAFPEGSPMHPSYGTGHGSVAGACVTIVKAFFDTDTYMIEDDKTGFTFGALGAGKKAVKYIVDGDQQTRVFLGPNEEPLKLEHELNKLSANVAIGRNMAGVHYYSDYYDSLRLGEKVAIGILEEQALLYQKDEFVLGLTTFDGKKLKITRDGSKVISTS